MTTHFDLIIVGSGSGNSLVTPEFDDWRIAIVEEGVFGGTCLNRGCIPTKMFVYPADLAENAAHADRYGLQPAQLRADWPAIRDRIFGRIDPISAAGRKYRESGSANVTLYETHAEFTGPRELRLGTGETITGGQIVLAAGSRPVIPPPVRDSGVPYYTSDDVMRLPEQPRRLVIIGAGYIAAEFAHVFTAFGTEVHVISRTSLLRELDWDITSRLTHIVQEPWHLHVGAKVARVSGEAGAIAVTLTDGTVVEGDALMCAAGRMPNSDRLGLEAGGVKIHEDGRVVVDDYQRTTADGVWALGDICSPWQLKHVANHEAKIVAHNIAHPDDLRPADHRFVPSAVFTHPQLASVGLPEHEARDRGLRYITAIQEYGDTAYGWAMEDTTSICKLIADPDTGLLIGAHLMGDQASTLIQPLIQAMSFGLGVREMATGQYWIHPALTEVVENALLKLDV